MHGLKKALKAAANSFDRVYRLITTKEIAAKTMDTLDKIYNEVVKTVTEHLEAMRFNTAISQLMIFVNAANKEEQLFLIMLRDLFNYWRRLHRI